MNQAILEELDKLSNTFKQRTDLLETENGDLKSRLEMIEAQADRPQGTGSGSTGETREEKEHRELFNKFLRAPNNSHNKGLLDECVADLATKDVSIGTSAEGGYALPKYIDQQLTQRVFDLNPMRKLVRVQGVGTNDSHFLVSRSDNGAGWVAEGGTRSATASPSLIDRAPTTGELYAYLTASNWSLDDLLIDVQDWLTATAGKIFASMEATAIISGNGTARPTGILNTTTVTTEDSASPERDPATIQYISANVSPLAVNYDALVDTMAALHETFLPNAVWLMNRTTLGAVQKLKDTDGRPLWQPSLIAGQPSTLLGFPLVTCEAMPTTGDVILFGDFSEGYILADRPDTSRLIVDQVTSPGNTKFYISRRVGGCVLNSQAIKSMKLA